MKKKVVIVGGGACSLILGCELDPKKFDVSIYERNAALGRKFLVAGDGGLNLTHSEAPAEFIKRYTPRFFLEQAFFAFTNKDFIKWLNNLGVGTFEGSSGRIFPAGDLKPIDVLNIFLKKMKNNSVSIHTNTIWKGFSDSDALIFENQNTISEVKADFVIFCLGGASWPVTGSRGEWLDLFRQKGVKAKDFKASNCACKIEWPEGFLKKAEGKALKNASFRCMEKTIAGEAVITRFGIEGSGIYPLSPELRKQLEEKGQAGLFIDLKPALTRERINEKIKNRSASKNYTAHLKDELNLNTVQIELLKSFLSKEDFLNSEVLSFHIKNFSLTISGTAPVEEAISTVGGIELTEIDAHFQLKKLPHFFAIGEMLDYDAPTGGYLLQSCFSMGKFVAELLNNA